MAAFYSQSCANAHFKMTNACSSMHLILFLDEYFQGNKIYKTAFVAFFQGEQLKSRIKKVCTGFHASLYPCPTSNTERQEMAKGVKTRLEDLNLVRDRYVENDIMLIYYIMLQALSIIILIIFFVLKYT